MANKRTTYTAKFKLRAVKMITTIISASPRSVGGSGWPRTAGTSGTRPSSPAGPPPSRAGHLTPVEEESRRLRAENKRLAVERDVLKKATAFFAAHAK